jgi:hypothetical protein
MKKLKCLLGFLVTIAFCQISHAQSVPQPEIAVAITNTTQLAVTITNGVSFANYELYHRTLIDPAYPWTLMSVGSLGQSNFVADMGIENIGFYQVAIGSDWDGDGIPNSQDGDPSNASVGKLTITIDSPLTGTLFN